MNASSLVLLTLLIRGVRSEFSYDFYNFIAKHYGEKHADHLEMSELRGIGSFGGSQTHNFIVNHKPIVFVHGAQSYVNMFWNRTEFLRNHSYSFSELYATNYNDKYNVSCENIKQNCESIARNFNDSRFLAFCDPQIGLQPKSAVMLELNNQSQRYEGSRLFSIHSDNDEVIGQRCDLNDCSEIKNATMTFTKSSPAHVWLSFIEMELPFLLFTSNSTTEIIEVARSRGFNVHSRSLFT
ncbi:hypothetical protein M3Y95_01154600 [Aphelenchoides besseyi]|nr:hypothetical protein M3Y95_01154600 [Aphelenchoides besseyi]